MSLPPLQAILLASSSSYRKKLLDQLQLPYSCFTPNVDETPLLNEAPSAMALRLAEAKARAGLTLHPSHIVIGSDQTAALGNWKLGKPGTLERAREQLAACSQQTVLFHSGVSVATQLGITSEVISTEVTFKKLSLAQIDRYLDREHTLDCAGSFKCEGLGITLFSSIRSDDPTALVGLPLIALTRMLERCGIALP